jgi:hypothetical protein
MPSLPCCACKPRACCRPRERDPHANVEPTHGGHGAPYRRGAPTACAPRFTLGRAMKKADLPAHAVRDVLARKLSRMRTWRLGWGARAPWGAQALRVGPDGSAPGARGRGGDRLHAFEKVSMRMRVARVRRDVSCGDGDEPTNTLLIVLARRQLIDGRGQARGLARAHVSSRDRRHNHARPIRARGLRARVGFYVISP